MAYLVLKVPTAAAQVAGGVSWSIATNILSEDGSVATSGLIGPGGGGGVPNQLTATGFGYSLPSNAVIQGVKLELKVSGPANDAFGGAGGIMLLYNGGSTLPTNNPNRGTGWPAGPVAWITYGSSTSLWGRTWTPSEINNSNFGASFSASLGSGTGTVTVDAVRITVYWDYAPLPKGTIKKDYLYQVYRQGTFLGLLPSVTSDFAYSQDINTAGAQINITCAINPDTSGLTPPTLETEDGNPIQAEDGTNLTTERYPDIVGNFNSNALFRNGNQLLIYEISNYHQNGQLVFSGDIERWETAFGGATGDQIKVVAYSDGADLNNFAMTGGDTLDQSQTTASATFGESNSSGGKFLGWNLYGETFVIGGAVTNLEAVSIYTTGGDTATLAVYSSVGAANSGAAPLAQTTQAIPSYGSPTEVKFIFGPVLTVTPGQSLFFTVTCNSGLNLYGSSTDTYGSGSAQNSNYGGGSGGGSWGAVTGDLAFKTYTGGGTTTFTYSSYDPTNIVIDAVNRYNSMGGSIRVASGSTDLTGRSLSYSFKVATVLEGVQKALDLAPYDWYWYVDIGSDTIFFKEAATSAKWYLTKGKEIGGLNMVATTENVKNALLFSGGNTGSNNLYSQYSDAVSITNNKQRLERRTDNRVTVQGTADAFGNSFIASSKNETYQTTVTVLDTTMDISLFKLGDTVSFQGFGNFIDNVVLQIVRIQFSPDQVTLTVGNLPPQTNQTLKDIERQLNDLNTLANPNSPS